MQLHELKTTHKKKKKKRVGRGGKRGTYSGKGQKGQKSRAGRKLPKTALETLLKIPKLRGIKNKPAKEKPLILKVGELDTKISDPLINKENLLKDGIIKRKADKIKILGNGEVKKSYTIKGIIVSKTAKEKIEKAGGKIS